MKLAAVAVALMVSAIVAYLQGDYWSMLFLCVAARIFSMSARIRSAQ